jgi:hypothetical protein
MTNRRQAVVSWLGGVIGLLVAASAALREDFGPAAVVAAGALFLIYWGFRVDEGER